MEEKNLFVKLYELFSDENTIHHYAADTSYLKKAWNYYTDNNEVWEKEKRHVANTLGLSILELKSLLISHQNISANK